MSATHAVARTIPGPSPWQALPELVQLRRDPLGWVDSRRHLWGDTWALRPPVSLLGDFFAFTTSPAGVRDVLTNADTFVKSSPVYEEMAMALGDGLLTSQGDRWKSQKRTLQPLFTRKRVDRYAETFVESAALVADQLRPGTIDLDAETQKISLRSVSMTLFGTDVTGDVQPIIETTGMLSEATVARGLAPITLPLWVPTPRHRALARAGQRLEEKVDAIVDESRVGAEDRDDLVALLLSATDPETGAHLTDVEVREQALVFLLAGYDTTSTSMTFTLWLLANHPDIQDDVRDEVRSVLSGRPATAEDLPKLALTRRVVDEAMRLYPPAYITSRSAVADATFDGFEVPAGGVVATSFWGLHRNPDVWPDPTRFDPDRFLPEAVKGRDSYAYAPFGGGPRACIGSHFALLEATLGIATFIDRWRLESDGPEPALSLGITLRPAGAVPATITRA